MLTFLSGSPKTFTARVQMGEALSKIDPVRKAIRFPFWEKVVPLARGRADSERHKNKLLMRLTYRELRLLQLKRGSVEFRHSELAVSGARLYYASDE